MPYAKAIAAAVTAMTLQPLFAEETTLSEMDFINDLPITFAATRLPQQLSAAPASVTIIDRAMIDASSATSVSELLRLVPGMQSYHIATNASAVSYHGMSDKFPPRMEVMIDGRSVYIPLFSAVIWETLPISIDDIERIEVVRGTNTVTQGSNAFLGAINIITHSALDNRDNIVKASYGEFDSKTLYGRYSGATDLGYYSLSAGITGNDGSEFIGGTSDPYYQRYLTFNGTYSPSLRDTFTINLGLNNGYSYVGDVPDKASEKMNRREFDTHYQNIEWKRLVSDNRELIIRYSHSLNNLDADMLSISRVRGLTDGVADDLGIPDMFKVPLAESFLESNPFKQTSEIGKIEQHNFEISEQWQPDLNNKLIAGLEYRYGKARNYQLLDTHKFVDEDSSRIFAHWENTQDSWIFNFGASVENGGNSSTRVSPRIAANYLIDDAITLRSSASRAFRMPSLLESNFSNTIYVPPFTIGGPTLQDLLGPVYDLSYIPNPDLKPEQLDSVDIGLLAQWPEYHSSLDVRLFYEEINNGITETNIGGTDLAGNGVHTYTNQAEWHNQGIEFQYIYQGHSALKPLVVLNYGYIESDGERVLDENTPWIDPLKTRNPKHTASALASITLPENLQVSLSHYFLSSVQWIEAQRNVNTDPANPPYHRTDLKVSKAFQLSQDNALKLSLIIQNLLDNPYSEFYAENIFEQRTYLQAQLSF